MDIVGLIVPLMKVSVILFALSTVFLVLDSINEIDGVRGRIEKRTKKK